MGASAGAIAPPASASTADRLLSAPLERLLVENNAELIDSSTTDPGFFGAVVQRKDGDVFLTMPTGRSELEHDTMARYLLAQIFDIDLPKLPAPFITTSAGRS
ncbi:hypothetical protein ABZ953_06740 [Streptomyces sp. NPDC046465]|uniref:hypothetical protein n=1 Tax=Streptomyces sp. NPDC046465 TaxID=3155810 RepID=UPI0033F77FF0